MPPLVPVDSLIALVLPLLAAMFALCSPRYVKADARRICETDSATHGS